MKILLIHKYHHMVGGAERYYFDLYTLLTRKGHDVAFFSMNHADNLPSTWSNFFVSNINFKDIDIKDIDIRKGVKIFFRMLYSHEARQKIAGLLDVFKPDIAHIHNIYYHISPSVLMELKKRNIPVVYTVHDYHLVTPNVTFFHDNALCTISLKNSLFTSIFHKCVQDSRLASLATSLCLSIHDAFGAYKNTVDFFISPSFFMKNILINNGYSSKKIVHLPNFITSINNTAQIKQAQGKYVLYIGDTSRKKGLHILLDAAKRLPFIPFYIVGGKTEELKHEKKSVPKPLSNITFLGHIPHDKIKSIIIDSVFTVVPSLWYENQPYTILEAFSLGKPVVASNIGGIPEIVLDGKNGILFEPGNIDALTQTIERLWKNPKKVKTMSTIASRYAREHFNPDHHYKKLLNIYKNAIQLHTKQI